MCTYITAQRNGEPWAQPIPQHVAKPANFQANIYRPCDGRERWGVLETATGVWYFPKRYGWRASAAMARRLNRGI